ncbi:MAG: LamG domain-containing protein, partial [Planctomycetota bacterium]
PGSLDPGQTYYWKINEVNMAEVPSTWEGAVWSFTTALCITLDDMEDYVDRSELRGVWTDGYASVGWGGTYPLHYPLNTASSGSNLNASTGVGSPVGATGTIHSGSQGMVLRYDNDGHTYPVPGEEDWDYDAEYFSEIEANTVENLGVGQDWTVDDVKFLTMWFQGHPIPDGSWAGNPLWPELAVTGRGRDIWGGHDEFYFIGLYPWEPGMSDSYVEGRVVAMDNTDPWAKAGIMVREKMTPSSRFAAVYVTPGQGISFQWRDVEGGPAGQAVERPSVTAPVYLKLDRTSLGAFTASYSVTGLSWDFHDVNVTQNPDVTYKEVPMDDPCLHAGFAVTSHNAAALCTADVNNFKAYPPDAGKWVWGNVGLNDPEQLYVALQDTMDNISVVEHDDVNAATLASWQEWNIPLTDFVGVDMNSIKKVRIGLGDRVTQPAGGSGAIYIDDIRTCPSKPTKCIPALAKPIGDIAQPYDCIVDEKDLRALAGDWLVKAPGDANLVGWWKLDDAFGATAQDSSIYGNHGTLINMDPVGDWITGQIGGALHFDGTNDYVDCGDTASLQITGNAISLAAWVKYETAEAAEGGIVMKTTDDWWADGYGLYVYSGAIKFYVYDWTVAAYKSFTADNQWHHVAGTYDGSNVRIWVDGVEGTPYSFTYGMNSAANSLQIGRGASNAYNFAGALDDVRLYNAVLTEADILGLLGLGADLYEDLEINFKDYAILADHYLEEILSPY